MWAFRGKHLGFALFGVVLVLLLTWLIEEPAPSETGLAPRESMVVETEQKSPVLAPAQERVAIETPSEETPLQNPANPVQPEVPTEEVAPGPGCITVIAHRDGLPAAYLPVYLIRDGEHWVPRDLTEVEAKTTRLTLDGSGVARACSLEPGEYNVVVDFGPGQRPKQRVELLATMGQTVRFDFDGGSISGRVFDDDGVPVKDALLTVSSRTNTGPLSAVWTDVDGAYRVAGLGEDIFWVSLVPDGSFYSDSYRTLQVRLAAGEAKRLDFGNSRGLPIWTGVVRNRAGNAIRDMDEQHAWIHVKRAETHEYSNWECGEVGSFSLRLEPGHYRISVELPGHPSQLEVVDDLEVPEHGLEFDLVVPGTRVQGRVAAPVKAVRAHIAGQTFPGGFYRCAVAADGTYAFDGLEPGSWRVGPSGTPLADFVDVQVGAADLVLSVDL